MSGTIFLSEFTTMPITDNVIPQMAMTPSIADQQIAIGASSTASNPFNVKTRYIHVSASSPCSIAFSSPAGSGATPTATTSSFRCRRTSCSRSAYRAGIS